mgnify:CR=1 FL=1
MSAKAYRAAGVDLEAADSMKENIVAFASFRHINSIELKNMISSTMIINIHNKKISAVKLTEIHEICILI